MQFWVPATEETTARQGALRSLKQLKSLSLPVPVILQGPIEKEREGGSRGLGVMWHDCFVLFFFASVSQSAGIVVRPPVSQSYEHSAHAHSKGACQALEKY